MTGFDHRRRLGIRILVALWVLVVVATIGALPAWGHVTVHPSSLPAGSSDVEITFRVPNERSNANTVMLQVYFPTNLPLLTVDVLPVPGWKSTVQTQNLSKPVQTDDGLVSQVVSEVTWTATAGGISQGQYEDFPIAAGAMPSQSGPLVFKALQTYSSGETVRWIEVPIAGQPQPDTPAPILTLTPPIGGTTQAARSAAGAPAPSATSTAVTVLAIVALVLGVTNSAVVLWLLLGRRRKLEE
jgi:uncharacterized protein YcnI